MWNSIPSSYLSVFSKVNLRSISYFYQELILPRRITLYNLLESSLLLSDLIYMLCLLTSFKVYKILKKWQDNLYACYRYLVNYLRTIEDVSITNHIRLIMISKGYVKKTQHSRAKRSLWRMAATLKFVIEKSIVHMSLKSSLVDQL